MTTPDERHITEDEYVAMLPFRAARIADELNERFADVLPPGVKFEWTTEAQP